MDAVFLKLLNMSITASWLILAVVVIRFTLKKAPKWMSCALWALVGLRLLLTFSFESVLSLIPARRLSVPILSICRRRASQAAFRQSTAP